MELKHNWNNPHPNIKFISGQILEEKYLELEIKYKKLLAYVKWISFYPNYLDIEKENAGIKAENLLKEIGESNEHS